MQITIKRKVFSLSATKEIFINNEELYVAKSDSFASDSQFKLLHKQSGYVKSIILHEAAFLNDWFSIRLLNEDNVLLKFARISRLKHDYEGFYKGDKYEIKENQSGKYYILKNGIEIAYLKEQNEIMFQNKDDFEILSSDSTNLELLISFCLIINLKENEKRNPD